jgi:hypothetical protein
MGLFNLTLAQFEWQQQDSTFIDKQMFFFETSGRFILDKGQISKCFITRKKRFARTSNYLVAHIPLSLLDAQVLSGP